MQGAGFERIFLLLSAVAILFVLAVDHLGFLLIMLALEVCILCVWRLLQDHAKRYVILIFFILMGAIPLLFERGTAGSLFQLGNWSISLSSLRLASVVALRSLISCLLVSIVLYRVPVYRLCQVLRSWAVPSLLIDLLELSYRYINLLMERGEHIKEAQLLRLGYVGFRQKYEHAGLLLSRSFILAHSEAEQMYEGLLTRRFDEASDGQEVKLVEQSHNMLSPIIELKDVSYSYGTNTDKALKNVSLSIGRRERIVLLGANGSGKSTLMKVLAGLIREQEGELWLMGQLWKKSSAALRTQRKRIALVMQNANHQLFCPTVEAEVAFGLRNSGLTESEVALRVEEIIAEYKLEALRHKPPHLLSEGQKKWVSIATIMALRPDVILMDEPTACLDCYYTDEVMKLASKYCSEGGTVILSTHDMNLAYSWGTRAIVMSGGVQIYSGAISTLYADRALLTTAKLRQPYGFYAPDHSEGCTEKQDAEYRLALFHHAPTLRALVIGGGQGATRKARTLLMAGAKCTIISPELDADLMPYLEQGICLWEKRRYTDYDVIDLSEYDLVVGGTDDEQLNSFLSSEALAQGKLVANLSDPHQGNIQFAALLDKSGVQIAVHTAYRLPEIAQAIRSHISDSLIGLSEDDLRQLQELRFSDKEAYDMQRNKVIQTWQDDRANRY